MPTWGWRATSTLPRLGSRVRIPSSAPNSLLTGMALVVGGPSRSVLLSSASEASRRSSGSSASPIVSAPAEGGQHGATSSPKAFGGLDGPTKYVGVMSGVQEYLVSSSGQMSLPASARHRWKLDEGGPVDVIDLGFGVLTVPRGEGHRLLDDLLSADEHAAFVRSLADDPDLATM